MGRTSLGPAQNPGEMALINTTVQIAVHVSRNEVAHDLGSDAPADRVIRGESEAFDALNQLRQMATAPLYLDSLKKRLKYSASSGAFVKK